jgi:hypothetical protein
VALIVATLLITISSQTILETNKLIINFLGRELSQRQLENVLNYQNKWAWLGYTFIPFYLLIKTTIITAILETACSLFDEKIKFKKLFTIVVKAEFLFLFIIILKTAWFYFFDTNYTLEDLQYFYPLSALNIVGYEALEPWFIYPLQVLNLFELAYWFVLAYLLGKELNISMDKGFKIVASSYGPALTIWVVAVMFFTLNYS